MDVDGQLVVVTGASSGIGKATAKRLAAEGGHVALLARTEPDLEAVAGSIRDAGGDASVFPVDLAKRDEVVATAERIQADLGDPDVLVNSAGIGSWRSIWETEPGEVERIVSVTVFGAFNLTRAFLPAMLERNRGHVVTVGSPTAHSPIPGATAYQTARYALRGFSESLYLDLYSTGVNVTDVVPGKVDTEYFDRNDNVEERFPDLARILRDLSPKDVAEAVSTGIHEEKRRVYLPPELRVVIAAGRLFPNQFDKLTGETGWQPTAAE